MKIVESERSKRAPEKGLATDWPIHHSVAWADVGTRRNPFRCRDRV